MRLPGGRQSRPWLWVSVVCGLLAGGFVAGSRAQSAALPVVYQGRLAEAGDPVSGTFDLRFTIFDAQEAGLVLGALLRTNVTVDEGLFTVYLDLQPTVMAEGGAWLEIEIKPTDSPGDFERLTPRQPITAAPYALFAPFAADAAWSQTAREAGPGAVTSESIIDRAITAPKLAPGAAVRSINGLTDHVNLVAGDNIGLQSTSEGLRISANSSAAEYPPVSQTLWVDPVYGDDATALRGRMDQPWLTLSNALAAVEDGDRLVLRPGIYPLERLGMPVAAGNYELEHARAPLLLKGRSGVTIEGESAIISASGLGSVFSITDCTNVTVRGLKFVGSGANPVIPAEISGEIVLWGTNSTLTFDHCQFEDFPNHGILVSQMEKTSHDTNVRDCVFRRGGTLQHGTLGLDGSGVASLGPGLKVTGCTFEDVVRGVEVEASYNSQPIGPVLIANNLFRNFWNAGVIVIPGNFQYLNDIMVADNVITADRQVRPGAVYQTGIRIHGGTRILVTGNKIGRCANEGISLTALAPLVDVSVANNLCWDNGGRNIAVLQQHNPVINAVIMGNYCLLNGQIASIQVSGRNISVTENTLIDSTGSAIRATSNPDFESLNIVLARNRIGRATDSAIAIDPAIVQTIIRDNHASMANPVIEDQGSDTQKDQAFLGRSRSYQPTSLQTVSVDGQILPNGYNVRVAGNDGPVTVQVTPAIAPGLDGQMLCILGTSDERTVTLQDQGLLPNSGLGLGASERTLGRGDVLTLRFEEADATWWEVSFSDKTAPTP